LCFIFFQNVFQFHENKSELNSSHMKKFFLNFLLVFVLILVSISGFSQTNTDICNNNIKHYWKLDETQGSDLQDVISNNNGLETVNTVPSSGKVGGSQYFNGTSEVNIANDDDFNWAANASFSIEFWMRKTSTCPSGSSANNNVIIGRDDSTSNLHWWAGVSCENLGKVSFNLYDVSGDGIELVGKTNLTDGSWHHVVVARDGGTSTTIIYVDGIRDTSAVKVYNSNFQSTRLINVGWLNLPGKYHYDGYLDELAVYNTALPANIVAEHYNSGNGMVYCGNSPVSRTRILTLGNSITEGWTDGTLPAGEMIAYRYDLKNLLETSGRPVDFVGSQLNGYAFFPDCQNAGISGTRDQYIARLLQDGFDQRNNIQILNPPRLYLDEFRPDVILLDVGTNDVTHETDAGESHNEKISQILDLVDQYESRTNKEVPVFLALIINRKLGEPLRAETSAFNDSIKAMALKRIQNNDNIVIVDMEHDAGFLYDNTDIASTDPQGIHPNSAGYNKMANLWYDSLQTRLFTGNTPPKFISHPVTLVTTPVYKYDATAIGSPNPTYSLVNSPSGMTINSLTGIITWNSPVSGTYPIRVTASNAAGSVNQDYTLTVGSVSVVRSDGCGIITARSGNPGTETPAMAFDNLNSTKWYNFNTSGIIWIQYQFCNGASHPINRYTITSANDLPLRDPKTVNLYGSNNGIDYTLLDSRTDIVFSTRFKTLAFDFANTTPYLYYRFEMTANTGNDGLQIAEIELIETGLAGAPPNTPSALNAVAASGTSINLTWQDNSTNEDGFEIYHSATSGSGFTLLTTTGANVTSYTHTDLTPSSTHYYQVRAINGQGNSEFTSEASATTQAGSGTSIVRSDGCGTVTGRGGSPGTEWPDKAFDNLTSTKWFNYNTSGVIWIQYQFCNGASYAINSYSLTSANDSPLRDPKTVNLYGSNNGVDYTLLDTRTNIVFTARFQTQTFSFTNSTAYQYYRFDMTANTGNDGLQLAEIELIETGVVSGAPNPPSLLNAVAASTTSIGLTWQDNSNNETGFEIYHSLTSGSGFTLLTTTGADATAYTHTGLTASSTHYYQIRAINGQGNSAFTSEASATTQSGSGSSIVRSDGCGIVTGRGGSPGSEFPDKAFDNLTSTKWFNYNTSGVIWIQYQFCNGASYAINSYSLTSANDSPLRDPKTVNLYGSNNGVDYTLVDSRTNIAFTARFQTQTFSFTNSTAYQYYRFDMTANTGNDGLQLAEIELIETGVVSGAPNPPSMLNAVAASSTSIGLTWQDNSNNETGFEIYHSLTSGSGFTLLTTTGADATAYTHTGLTPSTIHYYQVRAINGQGNSAFTSEASATTQSGSGSSIVRSDGCGTVTGRGGSPGSEFPDKAFDNLTGTKWYNYNTSGVIWIQYQFCSGASYAINSYSLTSANDSPLRDPKTVNLYGSNNGVDYTLLDSRTNIAFTARFQTQIFNFANSTAYQYYRFDMTANTGNDGLQLAEIELIETGVISGAPNPPANLNAVAASSTSINLTWQDNSNNETGFEVYHSLTSGSGFTLLTTTGADVTAYTHSGLTASSIHYYKVRAINGQGNSTYTSEASATTQSGSVSSIIRSDGCGTVTGRGGSPGSESPDKAFDNLTSTKWYNFNASGIIWIQYQFCNGTSYAINSYSLTSANDSPLRDPKTVNLYGSNNGVDYTLLDSRTNIAFTARFQAQTFNFANSTAYQYYRFDMTANTGNDGLQLAEIELIEVGVASGAPNPPASLNAVASSSNSIGLTWQDNSNNETGFEIYHSLTSGSGFTLLTTTGADATAFVHNGLAASTTHYYQVRAINGQGNSAFTSEASATTQSLSGTPIVRSDGCSILTGRGGSPGTEFPDKAFDNLNSTKWYNYNTSGSIWIQYQFCNGESYAINSYTLTSANDMPLRDPKNVSISGSNDGVNFTLLDTKTNIVFSSRFQTLTFNFTNSTAYQYYRFDMTANTGNDGLQLAEIELIEVSTLKSTRSVSFKDGLVTVSPNPFRDAVTIEYNLTEDTHVNMVVYDLSGRIVHQLANENQPEGYHRILWDALNDDGSSLRNGIYLLKVETNAGSEIMKIIHMQ
jgi:lysophospholipase L1-like esterase